MVRAVNNVVVSVLSGFCNFWMQSFIQSVINCWLKSIHSRVFQCIKYLRIVSACFFSFPWINCEMRLDVCFFALCYYKMWIEMVSSIKMNPLLICNLQVAAWRQSLNRISICQSLAFINSALTLWAVSTISIRLELSTAISSLQMYVMCVIRTREVNG